MCSQFGTTHVILRTLSVYLRLWHTHGHTYAIVFFKKLSIREQAFQGWVKEEDSSEWEYRGIKGRVEKARVIIISASIIWVII